MIVGNGVNRPKVDLDYLWLIKGRENYISVVKRLGIQDVCECEDYRDHKQRREGSGKPGQEECSVCGCLIRPMQYIYACDECTEPFLSEKYYLCTNEPALCPYCA
jgi:hypothetical protein